MRVKVARGAVVVGDKVHESGATFTAPATVVENGLLRRLVEKVEPKAKR